MEARAVHDRRPRLASQRDGLPRLTRSRGHRPRSRKGCAFSPQGNRGPYPATAGRCLLHGLCRPTPSEHLPSFHLLRLRRGRWIWLRPPLPSSPYDGHCRDRRPRRLYGRDGRTHGLPCHFQAVHRPLRSRQRLRVAPFQRVPPSAPNPPVACVRLHSPTECARRALLRRDFCNGPRPTRRRQPAPFFPPVCATDGCLDS